MSFSVPGCDDGGNQEPDPTCPTPSDTDGHDDHGDDGHADEGSHDDAGDHGDGAGGDTTTGSVDDGGSDTTSGGDAGETGDTGEDETGGTDSGGPEVCEPDVPEVTDEQELEETFADYTEDCDALGGYIQVHAGCSGVNTCAGFSVGDWDPDIRTDHSCKGMNGCNGLSCIFTPDDGGRTGQEVLELEAIPNGQPDDVVNGPAPCNYCHAVYNDDGLDPTRFKVWVYPGSDRTAENWLERSAAVQERIVAFGAHGVTDDGIAYASMAGYAKSLSRAEIERVVEYIRTLTPEIHVVKFADE